MTRRFSLSQAGLRWVTLSQGSGDSGKSPFIAAAPRVGYTLHQSEKQLHLHLDQDKCHWTTAAKTKWAKLLLFSCPLLSILFIWLFHFHPSVYLSSIAFPMDLSINLYTCKHHSSLPNQLTRQSSIHPPAGTANFTCGSAGVSADLSLHKWCSLICNLHY